MIRCLLSVVLTLTVAQAAHAKILNCEGQFEVESGTMQIGFKVVLPAPGDPIFLLSAIDESEERQAWAKYPKGEWLEFRRAIVEFYGGQRYYYLVTAGGESIVHGFFMQGRAAHQLEISPEGFRLYDTFHRKVITGECSE